MIFRKPAAKLLLKNFYISKGVSTWTPLATAFNSPPYKKINFTRNEAVRILYFKFHTTIEYLNIYPFPGSVLHARTT